MKVIASREPMVMLLWSVPREVLARCFGLKCLKCLKCTKFTPLKLLHIHTAGHGSPIAALFYSKGEQAGHLLQRAPPHSCRRWAPYGAAAAAEARAAGRGRSLGADLRSKIDFDLIDRSRRAE